MDIRGEHQGMVDIHCHMLPGIDDGSTTLEQSLAMARIAVDDGIVTTVVTPHHLNGVWLNRSDAILEHMHAFQAALDRADIRLKLLPGSELHLVPELPEELRNGTAMTVAGQGRAALVELPVHTVPTGTDRLLGQIQSQGLTPIIAHPERNSRLRQEPGLLAKWVAAGCLGQVTAQSCTGRFGAEVKAAAKHMVTSGLIHFLASDAHRDKRRIPRISMGCAVVEKWTNAAVARLLAELNPAALVRGESMDVTTLNEALSARHAWRRWLGG